MTTDVYLSFESMIGGGIIIFFFAVTHWLLLTLRRTKNYNARYVIRLLIAAMMLLVVKNITLFVLDMVNVTSPSDNYEYFQNIARLLEMMAIPLMGLSLVALVRLTPPRRTESVNQMLPLALSLGFYVVTGDKVVYHMTLSYILLYAVGVIIVVHVYAYRFHKLLNDTYANTYHRGVTWVRTTLYILVSLLVAWVVLNVLLPYKVGRSIYFVLSIIPWSFYAHRLMHHDFDVDVMRDIVVEEELKAVQGITDNEEEDDGSLKKWQEAEFGEAVTRYCSDVDNFRNINLSIMDVARGVGTNRTYVSLWCKEQGKNFSSFIADIRLDYAERMLAVNDYSIADVVEKAGFSSTRAFRAAFVARHKCPPTEYRARLNQQASV